MVKTHDSTDDSGIYDLLVPSQQTIWSGYNEPLKPKDNAPASLYRVKRTSIFGAVTVILYCAAAIVVLAWSITGPSIATGHGRRVFRTPARFTVDQFYSGVALAVALTPVAIIIRGLSDDFRRMHPFALASRVPVRMGDFDRIMQPGPKALRTLWRYSKWTAGYQGLLMAAGALLVPIGSLVLTTGMYAPQTAGLAVAGMPTAFEAPKDLPQSWFGNLSAAMGYQGITPFVPLFNDNDIFLQMAMTAFQGSVLDQSAILRGQEVELGPTATGNITFEQGVKYKDLVTFKWSGNCGSANDEVLYSVGNRADGSQYTNFTFPDGTVNTTISAPAALTAAVAYLWSNETVRNEKGYPIGGTSYLAMSIASESLSSLSSRPLATGNSDAVYENGTSIVRLKCTPRLQWQLRDCIYDQLMRNCTDSTRQAAGLLDTVGLDSLEGYMTVVLWSVMTEVNIKLGRALLASTTSPGTRQMTGLFGMIAESLVSVTTAGYFGTAEVQTVGEPAKLVYITRIAALVVVIMLLLFVAVASIIHLAIGKAQHWPIRRTTFLTIASAVQSPWWARELRNESVLAEDVLTRKHASEVMFGIDADDPDRVGLAPNVIGMRDVMELRSTRRQ